MAISSFNKRSKTLRVKITKQEMKAWSPRAGINIVQYAPNQEFTRILDHGGGLSSKIVTQSSGIGEKNIMLSTSAVHFIPTERRYAEDIEKALEGLNIITEKVTESEEPNHLQKGKNKEFNLEFMEHKTFVDLPTLDSIDAVRSRMTNIETQQYSQADFKFIENIMTRRPTIYGGPSNRQAIPRFLKEKNNGERNSVTGLKEYEAQVGTY